jgi:hypothetical protein
MIFFSTLLRVEASVGRGKRRQAAALHKVLDYAENF